MQQEDLLGEIITFRAVVRSHEEDAQIALLLCQRALALLSPENLAARTFVAWAQLRSLYASSANDAVAAVQCGLQSGSLAQTAGKPALAIGAMGATAMYMVGTGRLHEIERLTQQAIQLGTASGEHVILTCAGLPSGKRRCCASGTNLMQHWNSQKRLFR